MTHPVRVVFTKYDGSLRWHATPRRLGEDEHGVRRAARAGPAWQRAAEPRKPMAYARVSHTRNG